MKIEEVLKLTKGLKKPTFGTYKIGKHRFPKQRLDVCRCFIGGQSKLTEAMLQLFDTVAPSPEGSAMLKGYLQDIQRLRKVHIAQVEDRVGSLQKILPHLLKHARSGKGAQEHKELRQVLKDLLMLTATPVESMMKKTFVSPKEIEAYFEIPSEWERDI